MLPTSMSSSTILVTGRLCLLTTRFFTPSMTNCEDWATSLENMLIVLVPPPVYMSVAEVVETFDN